LVDLSLLIAVSILVFETEPCLYLGFLQMVSSRLKQVFLKQAFLEVKEN